MSRYIIAHDLGTSRHKAILTTCEGAIIDSVALPLEVNFPQAGWAEQSPSAWWEAVACATRLLLRQSSISSADIKAMAFTGQTQATLPVNAAGRPLCDALIWLDTRAEAQSLQLAGRGPKLKGYSLATLWQWLGRTNGLPTLSGRDSLAKTLWLQQMRPDIWPQVHRILDAKDYLLWRCTGRYATSYDCGHLTWLMDVRSHTWSDALLRRAHLKRSLWPALLPSTASAGPLTQAAAQALGLQAGIPVVVGASDVVSLAVGTGGLALGEASVGLGTSAWVAAHVQKHRFSVSTYTASITSAWRERPLVVAHQELGGGCVPWFLRMVRGHVGPAEPTPADYTWMQEAVRHTAPGAEGLLFAPWLAGEYAPLQDAHARGAFFGLGLQHQAAHLARAVLEGVGHNLRWALQAVEKLTGSPTPHLRLAGGGAQSDAWCQIIADICQRPVIRPTHPSYTTAQGAARLAALHLGTFTSAEDLQKNPLPTKTFAPQAKLQAKYDAAFSIYRAFYKSTRHLSHLLGSSETQAESQAIKAPKISA